MNKSKLKDILKRYTKSLKGASGETIITNYGRMRIFVKSLNREELGDELKSLCSLYTIRQASRAVKAGNISLKESSSDWNRRAIAKGYQLAKEIDLLSQKGPKHKERWLEKMVELAEMAYDEPSYGTQLCLMGLFFTEGVLQEEHIIRLKELLSEDDEPDK